MNQRHLQEEEVRYSQHLDTGSSVKILHGPVVRNGQKTRPVLSGKYKMTSFAFQILDA